LKIQLKSTLVSFLISSVAVVIFYYLVVFLFPAEELPVYQPQDLNPALVDKGVLNKSENHRVLDFDLINQNGERITEEDYNDKIYITDFFFTRCQTICPIMTNNMGRIQEQFLNNDDLKMLSISVTPDIDSVSILRAYADRKGVVDSKWNITTGSKKHIYELARKSYFAVVEQGDGGLQDFIHTTNFVLVDKDRQIRGIYDGTEEAEIDRLIHDVNILLP
jgi:protein SCO1/2